MITTSDERVLLLIYRLHYVTALQVQRRFYAPGSLTTVQTRLKRMAEAQLLTRIPLRREGFSGSAPIVYALARRGRLYLQSAGIEIPARHRPSEDVNRSGQFLAHTLAVNDVLIASELLSDQHSQIQLRDYKHEREMRRVLRAAIPDAWIDFAAFGYRVPIILELDRNTIEQARMLRKLNALMTDLLAVYPKLFRVEAVTIAFVTPTERRRDNLLQWIAAAAPGDCDAFRVTCADPVASTAEEFFLSPVWHMPGGESPVPLLEP